MACPLFLPARRVDDYFDGGCAADASAVITADTLRRCCNRGYARQCCEFAAAEHADAVQVLVKSQSGPTIEVAWSMERNHHPVAVGVVLVGPDFDDATPVATQARMLAEIYLEHKGSLT